MYFESNLRLPKNAWEHLCLKKITLEEWWRQQAIFPKSASPAHQPNTRAKSAVEGSSGLLRLSRCVIVSGHSESSLRRAIKDGRLKAHTVGRGRKRPTYRIYRCDLEAFIEASRFRPSDPPRVPTIGVKKKSRHFD